MVTLELLCHDGCCGPARGCQRANWHTIRVTRVVMPERQHADLARCGACCVCYTHWRASSGLSQTRVVENGQSCAMLSLAPEKHAVAARRTKQRAAR